jgi:hypothetical protein
VFRDPLQILANQNIEKIFFKFCDTIQKKGGIVIFVIDDTLHNVQNDLLA